jgi:hypothetical protein
MATIVIVKPMVIVTHAIITILKVIPWPSFHQTGHPFANANSG